MRKRILAFVLVLCFCFSLFPALSLEASAKKATEIWINSVEIIPDSGSTSLGSGMGYAKATISSDKLTVTLTNAKIGSPRYCSEPDRTCGVYIRADDGQDIDLILEGSNECYGDFLIDRGSLDSHAATTGILKFYSNSKSDLTVHGQTNISWVDQLIMENVELNLMADQSMQPVAFLAQSNIVVKGDTVLNVSTKTNDRPLGMFAQSLTVNTGIVDVYGGKVGAFLQPYEVYITGLTVNGGGSSFHGSSAALLIEDVDSYDGEPFAFSKCGEQSDKLSCKTNSMATLYGSDDTLSYYSWNSNGGKLQNIGKAITVSTFDWYNADFKGSTATDLLFAALSPVFFNFDAGEFGEVAGERFTYLTRIPDEPIGILPVPVNTTFHSGTFNNMFFEGWEIEDNPGYLLDESYIVPHKGLNLVAVWREGQSGMNFSDVNPSNWFYDAVRYCYTTGLINGTSATTFSPNNKCTRAMIVTMLYRMDGEYAHFSSNPFSDVPNNTWYTDAVLWAAENNIVSGDGKGHFNPNANATREQLAVIMRNYATYCARLHPQAHAMLIGFPDNELVSSWANDAMAWAVGSGFITGKPKNGKNYLDPKGNATRAEFATILLRYIKNFDGCPEFYAGDMFYATVSGMLLGNIFCRYNKETGDLSFYAKRAYDAQDGQGGRLFWICALNNGVNHTLDPNYHTLCGMLMNYGSTQILYDLGVFLPSDLQCPFAKGTPESAQYQALSDMYNYIQYDSFIYRYSAGVG